jgi:hypothetical protein
MAEKSRSQLYAQGLIGPAQIGDIRRPLQLCQIDKVKLSVPIKTFELKFCVVGIRLTKGAWADTEQGFTDRLVSLDGQHGGFTLERPLARSA